jgi:phage terminase large subunit GpA-like protein
MRANVRFAHVRLQGSSEKERGGTQQTPISIVPESTVALTLGIDTQSDGFFYLLSAFGRKMETWLPLTGRIVGDMRSEEPWAELIKVLEMTWLDKDGNGYKPVIAAMDVQGDYYPEALAFIKPLTWRLRLRLWCGQTPSGSELWAPT